MQEDKILQEIMGAMDRTIDERIKDLSAEESKYEQLYGKYIKYYLLDGHIVNGILIFNRGTRGINGPNKHFTNPLRYIDLEEVHRYFEESGISPDEKKWDDFEQSIDENAEKACPIYKDEELRYLSYFRFESGEYCYYDIQERKLYETGLLYEMSFHDKNGELFGDSDEHLREQMYKSTSDTLIKIIYNPESKCYGMLSGEDVIYDTDWLKDYTNYREEEDIENARQLIKRYRRNEMIEKEFLNLGMRKLDSMLSFIRNSVDGDIKVPKGMIDEMFDEYMDLFDYVSDIVLREND